MNAPLPDDALSGEPLQREETFVIEKSQPATRLDTYLRGRFPAVSRNTIQRLIAGGDILVNGSATKATHNPRAGETVTVRWPDAKPTEAQPEDIPLDILFEDKDLLVLNKPAGIVVHPSAGHDEHTLVNALLHHCRGQLSGIGGVARPGIVHRLDQETSGCLVVAKTDAAHLALASQFAGRSVAKIYHTLVCGAVPRAKGEIRTHIGRHATHRKRMTVTDEKEGREAWTSYKVLERFQGATFVEVLLHTGRTHQIRVHFQHLGFPVVGDKVYGQRHNQRLTQATGIEAKRQMLHASRITFTHPSSGEKITVEAGLPSDFREALEDLKQAR